VRTEGRLRSVPEREFVIRWHWPHLYGPPGGNRQRDLGRGGGYGPPGGNRQRDLGRGRYRPVSRP
jgi:hypothetical protein